MALLITAIPNDSITLIIRALYTISDTLKWILTRAVTLHNNYSSNTSSFHYFEYDW